MNNAGILRDKSFARISDADWGMFVNLFYLKKLNMLDWKLGYF